ncbi:MAG: sialate O-acetylesterase [Mediterranea sp.]|jgi:sialate O-acetylesterase|nr:sialate O-acetylesterase [Mediterranea sp.]
MNNRKKIFIGAAIASLLLSPPAQGKVELPAMMGNNMVLQQQRAVKLWGRATGKRVAVTTSWDKKTYYATPGAGGDWLLTVDTPAGGYTPHQISFDDGTKEVVTLDNVLVGEVWICSGQSNMEMRMKGYTGQPVTGALESIITSGRYADRIRFVTVPRTDGNEPRHDFDGQWEVPSPQTTPECSATAWYFARQLAESLTVPIGLVCTSWGGSNIELWMNETGRLYNVMLMPVKNFTARGFVWYQGESNRSKYARYAEQTREMVERWRTLWDDADMPFYYVQIAPYKYDDSNDTKAALFREAQFKALKLIPASGMVGTADVGDELCIHPPRKDAVGQRLATLALVKTYGAKGLPHTGPAMRGVTYDGGKATVLFNRNVYTGLVPREVEVTGFEIAGEDKIFHPAKALVKGSDKVEVWSDEVPNPVAVRYAFRNYVGGITLANTLGMPAFPFRTDTWEEIKN